MLARGLAQHPDAVWVCCEPKSDKLTRDVMLSLDIDPVVLPMNKSWLHRPGVRVWPRGLEFVLDSRGVWTLRDMSYDLQRTWRDNELLHLCDELIIFHKRTGHSPWRDRLKTGMHPHLYVVELGEEKKK
jgi:hypothetical protein